MGIVKGSILILGIDDMYVKRYIPLIRPFYCASEELLFKYPVDIERSLRVLEDTRSILTVTLLLLPRTSSYKLF